VFEQAEAEGWLQSNRRIEQPEKEEQEISGLTAPRN
jgi:hypothetical protein